MVHEAFGNTKVFEGTKTQSLFGTPQIEISTKHYLAEKVPEQALTVHIPLRSSCLAQTHLFLSSARPHIVPSYFESLLLFFYPSSLGILFSPFHVPASFFASPLPWYLTWTQYSAPCYERGCVMSTCHPRSRSHPDQILTIFSGNIFSSSPYL